MKVAVIGSGGREHALIWKLEQSLDRENIFAIPGNGGTSNNVDISADDFSEIRRFCERGNIDLVIVGPEAPLVDGIVDYFADSPIRVFGPDKIAAQLEGSKIWAKKFMEKHGVATAGFKSYENAGDPKDEIERLGGDLVIKFDGLAGGKGVFVTSTLQEATQAVNTIRGKYGDNAAFIIEEKLHGQEISIIGFTDGKSIKLLLPSQDHKPALDGDKGPNTGGMGAYCPVPMCDDALMKEIQAKIVQPTLEGIRAEDLNYKGVIYFGLMITNEGPKLLEYNVRLGDPEAEVILPALKSDLLPVITSCFRGNLGEIELEFNPGFYVDVVLTSKGYPGSYDTGFEISGIEDVSNDTLVFQSGTVKREDRILTAGGRVLNVVGRGQDLQSAINLAYRDLRAIHFKNMNYRKDIGFKGLVS
ncbi:MAG: phosphoribosylamine--glycine ligase [candidate division KSB1 bacterium]|jgi:phosphoribosylamine--glycine ligase|nr:phosphoribosylamine--glycine ligase [candidate division KSB1 bacterium]